MTEVRQDVKNIEDYIKEVKKIHSAILSAPVIDQSKFRNFFLYLITYLKVE